MSTARFLALVLFLSVPSVASAHIDTSRTSVLENPLARPPSYVCVVSGHRNDDIEKKPLYFAIPIYGISYANAASLQGEIIDQAVHRAVQKQPLLVAQIIACGFPGDESSWFEAIIEQ